MWIATGRGITSPSPSKVGLSPKLQIPGANTSCFAPRFLIIVSCKSVEHEDRYCFSEPDPSFFFSGSVHNGSYWRCASPHPHIKPNHYRNLLQFLSWLWNVVCENTQLQAFVQSSITSGTLLGIGPHPHTLPGPNPTWDSRDNAILGYALGLDFLGLRIWLRPHAPATWRTK